MSWPVIHLPDYDELKKQLKEKKWVDFYNKSDYLIGSEKSIQLIERLRNGKNNLQLVASSQKKKNVT